LTSLCFLLL